MEAADQYPRRGPAGARRRVGHTTREPGQRAGVGCGRRCRQSLEARRWVEEHGGAAAFQSASQYTDRLTLCRYNISSGNRSSRCKPNRKAPPGESGCRTEASVSFVWSEAATELLPSWMECGKSIFRFIEM